MTLEDANFAALVEAEHMEERLIMIGENLTRIRRRYARRNNNVERIANLFGVSRHDAAQWIRDKGIPILQAVKLSRKLESKP